MGRYEDEVEEQGEGVDDGDQEEGKQAREANLYMEHRSNHDVSSVISTRGGSRHNNNQIRAKVAGKINQDASKIELAQWIRTRGIRTMSPDRVAFAGWLAARLALDLEAGTRRTLLLNREWGIGDLEEGRKQVQISPRGRGQCFGPEGD